MDEFTIIGEKKFENEKILKKWKPVLDALKIEDEQFRLFMAVYFEYFNVRHPRMDTEVSCLYNSTWAPIKPKPQKPFLLNDKLDTPDLFVINMKILSRLNLEHKHYEIKSGLSEKNIHIPLSNDRYNDIKTSGQLDCLLMLEDIIINNIVDKINLELENKNEFYIDSIVDSVIVKDISSKSEESTNMTAVWDIKYEIIITTSYEIF